MPSLCGCTRNTVGASVLVATTNEKFSILEAAPKSPLAFMATTEISPASPRVLFNRSARSLTAFSHAFCGERPSFMRRTISYEITPFIKSSPRPVAVAPPIVLSTYNPEPIKGESPTRPGFFIKSPLVEVPATISPDASNPTIPTVSCPAYGVSCSRSISFNRLWK